MFLPSLVETEKEGNTTKNFSSLHCSSKFSLFPPVSTNEKMQQLKDINLRRLKGVSRKVMILVSAVK